MIHDFCMSIDRSIINADPGLGKTVATLWVINQRFLRGDIRGVLVVAPLRVAKYTWPSEIAKWDFCKHLKVANLRTAEGWRAMEQDTADIYVINYDLLPRLCEKFLYLNQRLPFDMVVWDEVHHAKDPASKRINKFRKVNKKFTYRLGMTGTLIANGYADVFAPVRLIDSGELFDKRVTYFRKKYLYNPDGRGFKWVVRDEELLKEIEDKLDSIAITLRAEDWSDVPPITYHEVEVVMPDRTRKLYKELEKEFYVEVGNGEAVSATTAAVLIGKFRQMASGNIYDDEKNAVFLDDSKIQALKKLLKKLKGKNVLIATSYVHEREAILKAIPEARLFNEKDIDSWNRGEIPIWVSQFQSIAEGLNLQQGGHTIIWFSLNYSYLKFTQYNARLARKGQDYETDVYRLVTKDSIDEIMVEVLRHKFQEASGLKLALKLLQDYRK